MCLFASSPCTHRFFPNCRRRFCVYADKPPFTLKDSPRILRRKNEEDAERNFHFQQFLTTLNGQFFEKIEWDIFKKNLSLHIWRILITAKNERKLVTSQLVMVQHGKHFRSFLSVLDGLGYAKKTISLHCPFNGGYVWELLFP